MSSEEEKKTVAAPTAKKAHHFSVAWWFGIIILILIAISFVLAPALQAVFARGRGNGLTFGSYNGTPITFQQSPDNYFFNQYELYANNYQKGGDPQQAMLQIWRGAYQSTVIHTALSQMADKAGVFASQRAVNDQLIRDYTNEDGIFDVEAYNSTPADQKQKREMQIRSIIPAKRVIDDITGVLSSGAETEQVTALMNNSRPFSYAAFTAADYPDEKALAFAQENPALFTSFDIDMSIAASEEEAATLKEELENGTQEFASKDTPLYYFLLTQMMDEADSQALITQPDTILGPFEMSGQYLVARVKNVKELDTADEKLIPAAKSYLANSEESDMNSFLSEKAAAFAKTAKEIGFDEAAAQDNITPIQIPPTPMNLGNSQILGSLAYADRAGYLANLQNDAEVMTGLYNAEDNSVSDVIESSNAYLVVRAGAKTETLDASYLKDFYGYITRPEMEQNLNYSILSSDKFEDDFISVYFSQILGY